MRSALAGETGKRKWTDLLAAATVAGASAGEQVDERLVAELELAPSKERKKLEREAQEGRKRVERRARAKALDSGLALVELWLRDMMCLREGAQELVYGVDRMSELEVDAKAHGGASARAGVELVRETRARIALNVGEELALEALAYRLQALVEG